VARRPCRSARRALTRLLQGWGSKLVDTKQSFPRKAEGLLEHASAAAASAIAALAPDTKVPTAAR